MVNNSTSELDNSRKTIWILARILEMNAEEIANREKNIFLKIIQDRSTVSISNVFNEYIHEGTLIKIDGWAAYPSAIRRCNEVYGMFLCHEVVDYSVGFGNDDRTHTNTIENFWSYVRCAWRTNHGVNRTMINELLMTLNFKKIEKQ